MPWKEVKPMDQKLQLIADFNSDNFSKTDLSRKYDLSRKTVHKWLLRYQKFGIDGLKDQSKEPYYKPNSTKKHIVQKIIDCKLEHPKRGPKKIFHILLKKYPEIELPAPSTIGYWLKKNNLVIERRKIKRVPSYNNHFAECLAPNDSWSIDYKGQFYTQNKRVCYPLTVSDNFSRYLLKCQCLPGPRHDETKAVLEQTFREYGIPRAIRSDNGIPFASKSIAGLSRLSIWFIQLGIIPERIDKGCPAQNGRHERMHKTLKYETLDTVAKNMKEQQERFGRFKIDYNYYRPHEALGQKTPNDFYQKSLRPYVDKLRKPIYDYGFSVREIHCHGDIKFNGQRYFLTELLKNQPVGLKQVDEDNWDIYYSFFPIASLNIKKNKIFSK